MVSLASCATSLPKSSPADPQTASGHVSSGQVFTGSISGSGVADKEADAAMKDIESVLGGISDTGTSK